MKEKLHIIPHQHNITKVKRNEHKKHSSFVLWFTGLSGSGKSTLANAVEQELYKRGIHTFLLDGDNIRKGLNKDLDFSDDSRVENIRRIGEVANLMVEAGIVTLSAFISPFSKERQMVRELVGTDNYIEIYVKCSLEVCEKRDIKGLYKKARKGEISSFTGISSPFEEPDNPNITIETDKLSIEDGVNIILKEIESKIKLK